MRTGLCRSHPRHLELSPSTREWTLIYDGDCAFCRRCVALLERWDRRGRVRAVPFQAEDALVGLPSVADEDEPAPLSDRLRTLLHRGFRSHQLHDNVRAVPCRDLAHPLGDGIGRRIDRVSCSKRQRFIEFGGCPAHRDHLSAGAGGKLDDAKPHRADPVYQHDVPR